jgi:polysaccharide biosynthesis/export protein
VKRNSPVLFMGMLLAISLGSSTQAHQEPAANSASAKPSVSRTEAAQQAAASTTDADYKIGPQDVLRIDVWKENEISRITPVRPDGRISLPLLNDVQAAGLTPTQLAGNITEGLKKFITNPQVTVGVNEINSRRVYVSGEVTKPGAFPLQPGMTVLQALTSSGGFTQFAKIKGIYVLRTENGKQVKYPFNYKSVVSGKHPELNIVVEPGDVIVVP